MKNRIIASIVGIVIASGIFLGWLFLHSSNSIVPVTGTIPGQPNKQIKIGNETVKTDNYGQFFIHIFTNKTYKINSDKIHFTIKANKNGKVKTTGNVKKNLVLSTPQKTVQMTIKSGVPYFDNNSHYFYNENTHKLTLTTNFQLKKGDKIVLSPKQNNSGLAFTINTIYESNGQVQATVRPTKIQNVLNDFQIHTGEVEGNDLTTSNTSVASLRPMDLTIGNDKKSKWIHQDIIAKLKPQSSAKHHTLSGNVTGSTDISGSFQIDANYDFLNPNNDYIKSKSSLSVSEQLAAEFKADYSLKDENGNLITIATYDTPIPFVKVPIQMYLNASADVSAKLHTSFSPTITANATFKNGFQLNYNKAVPQADFSFNGKIKGDEGFVLGPDITAYVTDLFTIGAKVGFDGNAEVNGQLSTSGDNSFTGTGNLNFGVYILATSPFLDELSGKKGNFTVEKQIIKNVVFNKDTGTEQKIVDAANKAVSIAEKAKSDANSNVENKKKKAEEKSLKMSMDLNAIKSGDLSSIKGTWRNEAGNIITVTNNSIAALDVLNGITIYSNSTQTTDGIKSGFAGGFGTSNNGGYEDGEINKGIMTLPTNGSSSTPFIFLISKGASYADLQPTGVTYDENAQTPGHLVSTVSKGDYSDTSKDRIYIGQLAVATIGKVATEITQSETGAVYYRVNSPTDNITISTEDQAKIDSSVKIAQESIDKITFSWAKTKKEELQTHLNKVSGIG